MNRSLYQAARILLAVALLAAATFVFAQEAPTPGGTAVDTRFVGRPDNPAPEFPAGLDWLNVPEPLTLRDLRGKIVLLDFWTYGCINCIHMIPTLKRLEERYGDALVVIGVHSAKFENEAETENLRQIIQRYELHHPVVNDSDFQTWRTYRVRAWPTFVLIDPRGNILAMQAGEIPFDAFDRIIGGMVDYFDSIGELNREPIELALEGAGRPPGALAFPGKVLADAGSNRLFIADTNHHRIIIADLATYEVLRVIGSGQRGFQDGTFETAAFNNPHGMALVGDVLYVADTTNHAVRAIDLRAETVTTVAGTGVQSYQRYRVEDGDLGDARALAISSPWDVALGPEDTLYIAMAGPHQIWALNLQTATLRVAVGNGREALLPGTFAAAELAQPSGLAYRDGLLYFADSESSSIRVADERANFVRTVAGPAENTLFDFGAVDGPPGVSRLQHPLGVTIGASGEVYVADTYNNLIRVIDPETFELRTLFGGAAGFRDGTATEAAFYEPGGLSYANGRLYVADTNNHAVRVIDLEEGIVSTVIFPNPQALQIADRVTVIGSNSPLSVTVTLEAQTVLPGDGAIVLLLRLPDGYKINPDAPSRVEWNNAGDSIEIGEEERAQSLTQTELLLPVVFTEGEDVLSGHMMLYYCAEDAETLCYLDEVIFEVPVIVRAGATETVVIVERDVMLPDLPSIGGF